MDHRRIKTLRREIDKIRRRGGIRATELEHLAERIGRERHPRGKEPTWVHPSIPQARPSSIPKHPGDLNRFTARAILNQLEEDVDMLESMLDREEEE